MSLFGRRVWPRSIPCGPPCDVSTALFLSSDDGSTRGVDVVTVIMSHFTEARIVYIRMTKNIDTELINMKVKVA